LLERLSGRLIAVHISDRIREFVDHVIPGEGFIDFSKLCALLAKAKIEFPLMLEVMTANSSIKDPRAFLKAAKEASTDLENRIRT
jgi:sugar phosphate isomerase/epimerase